MAHYALWGDTHQWDKFGSLSHDDAVVIIDAGPRPDDWVCDPVYFSFSRVRLLPVPRE